MTTLSLDLRGLESTHTLPRETPAKGASLSLLLHSAGISTLVLIPFLQSTSPPEVANAIATPLVRPITVILPPAPRLARTPAPNHAPRTSLAPLTPATPTTIPDSLRPDVLDPDADLGARPGVGSPDGLDGTNAVGGDCPLGSLCGPGLPPIAEPAKIVRIGGDIKEPRLLESRTPQYPPLAQAAFVSGRVVIEAHVGGTGRILEVRVIESHTLFDEAALASVRSRRYQPLFLNGVPTDFLVTITVAFNARR